MARFQGTRRAAYAIFLTSFRILSQLGLRKSHTFDRLYWLLFMRLAGDGSELVQVDDVRICVDRRDLFVSSLLIRDQIYEEYETKTIRRSLETGNVFVDVGAQIGYYTLLAANDCGPTGRVYSFEPNPRNFQFLSENVRLNHFANVIPVNKAVSRRSARVQLFIDSYNMGKHSLAEVNVTAIDRLGGIQEVDTISLDEYLRSVREERVDVIKIDAEGAEGMIIEGAVETLKSNDPLLFVEVWPFGQRNLGTDPLEMFRRLGQMGFQSWRIDDSKRQLVKITDPAPLCRPTSPRASFNILFARKQSSD